MRWFWLFILGLVIVTAGLYTKRVRTNTVVVQPPPTTRSTRPPRERTPRTVKPKEIVEPEIIEKLPETTELVESENGMNPEPVASETTSGVITDTDSIADAVGVDEPEDEFVEVDAVKDEIDDTEMPIETVTQSPSNEPENQEKRSATDGTQIVQEEPINELSIEPSIESSVEQVIDPIIEPIVEVEPAPSFEQITDGSFRVLSTGTTIVGKGTQDDPFVLDWITLRSIEQVFNPKKDMDELPDWLDILNERYVKIIGNTLVPVIATTTQELLVMQNPWDGCCIGIPPSPYDAIEVILNHDVDFGSSAVGFGTVEGVFILDPYVVDGWVLGLYIIEDATYRSGDGIAFPDF